MSKPQTPNPEDCTNRNQALNGPKGSIRAPYYMVKNPLNPNPVKTGASKAILGNLRGRTTEGSRRSQRPPWRMRSLMVLGCRGNRYVYIDHMCMYMYVCIYIYKCGLGVGVCDSV